MKNYTNNKLGFTLMELLIVILIIGILVTVALPQMQRAIMKSRFNAIASAVKPVVLAQESFFMDRGGYAKDNEKSALDVSIPDSSVMTISLSDINDYNFVLAQRSDVPGAHYIQYQQHSPNYANEIHCEAENGNTKAQWLCSTLSSNNIIGQTLTSGFTTYLIAGAGQGIPFGGDSITPSCDAAEALGLPCTLTTNAEGKQVKQVCTTAGGNNFCSTRTYNTDGTSTKVTCHANAGGVCIERLFSYEYDSHGNMTQNGRCGTVEADGSCSEYDWKTDYIYDSNGNLLKELDCYSFLSNGSCEAYDSGMYYSYDSNGNLKTTRSCDAVATNGSCSEYGSWGNYDYTYDANGNNLTSTRCTTVAANGSCSAYASSGDAYTYDANGNLLSYGSCPDIGAGGSCLSHPSSGYAYQYDSNGKLLGDGFCDDLAANGSCNAYSFFTQYVYDNPSDQKPSHAVSCSSPGNCDGGTWTDFTYDSAGNLTEESACWSALPGGGCSSYDYRDFYVYDSNGNKTTEMHCDDSTCENGSASYTIYDDDGMQTLSYNCDMFDGSLDCY